MIPRRSEWALIEKCQKMLKDERKLAPELRDHEFIKMVLDTIAQLRAQIRKKDAATKAKAGAAVAAATASPHDSVTVSGCTGPP